MCAARCGTAAAYSCRIVSCIRKEGQSLCGDLTCSDLPCPVAGFLLVFHVLYLSVLCFVLVSQSREVLRVLCCGGMDPLLVAVGANQCRIYAIQLQAMSYLLASVLTG